MKVGARRAALTTQAGNDSPVHFRTIFTQLGAEILPGLKVDLGARCNGVGGGISRCVTSLAVMQRYLPICILGCYVGVDTDIALGVQRQFARCIPANRIVNEDITVAPGRALNCRADGDAGSVQVGTQLRTGNIAAVGGNGEVVRVDQIRAGFAFGRLGRYLAAFHGHHFGCAGFNKAAIAPLGCRGVQCAAHVDAVVLHIAQQVDLAVFTGLQGLRLGNPGMVDNRGRQIAGRFGR